MFLDSLKKRFASINSVGARECGSALIGVLGVMGVTSVIGVTSVSMSIHAVGYSTSTRAGVQAEAAARAGVDFAAANLATSVCQSQYSSTTAPVFAVTVAYSTLQASPGDVDTSWVSGCPTTTSAARLRLISTGWASSLGVAGNSSNDIRRVEAIYSYTPTPASYQITPSGPALYSFAQTNSILSNLTITQASTVRPSIQFLSGNVTCASGTTINGDVVLGAGSFSVASGCTIDGDLWASSLVNIQSGAVTGNVNSDSDDNESGESSVSLSSSAKVDGDVHSKGSVKIDGKVGGDVVAGTKSEHQSRFSSGSSIGGSVVTSGTVSTSPGVVKGTITTNQSGIITPAIPAVPGWIDYAYNPNDWKTSTGAPYVVIAMTACGSTNLANAINTVQNSAAPIILDTRVCGPVTDFAGYNLTLTSDTVIVANGINMGSNNIQSSNASDKRLWIIIPDTVADNQPTVSASSSARIGSNVTVGSNVGAMIYSPYTISNSGALWRGQIYASSIDTSTNFTLNFLPIGLPGVNLSTGQFLPPPGTGVLGERTSIRDLSIG